MMTPEAPSARPDRNKQLVQVRVPPRDRAALRVLADEDRTSVSDVLRRLIRDATNGIDVPAEYLEAERRPGRPPIDDPLVR